MTRVIRLGFAGCGEVAAEKHMPAITEVRDHLVLSAAADVEPDRLRYVQRRFGIPTLYPSVDALIGDATLDAVAVCLPPPLQVDAAIAALDAGKHVWIDPPTGLSVEDSDRLVACAERCDRTVIVGFHMRWHRLVRETRALVESGRLGRIHAIRAVWSSPRDARRLKTWRRRRVEGGGALVEVAIDHFDLWRHILDSEIAELFATSVDDEWEDAAAVISGRMTNGTLVSAVFAERGNHDMELEVYGDRGRVRVSLMRFDGVEVYPDGRMAGEPRARLARLTNFIRTLPGALPRMHRMGDYRTSYRDQWRHFHDCIVSGAAPQCTLVDGRQALRAMLAGLASASSGAMVKV